MHALATVVEIDNRLIGKRFKTVIPIPHPILLHRLRRALLETNPDTGRLTWIDEDPYDRAPVNAYVCLNRWGAIRIVIWAADSAAPADSLAGLPLPLPGDERGGECDLAAELDPGLMRKLKNLAENVRRRMGRAGLTLERLAAEAGVCVGVLAAVIDGTIDNPCLTVVCALAEYFGTTMEALMAPPEEERAG
jgi:hypothetical protein